MAIYTGLRRGEILGLRWRDLDLGAGVLHVRRTRGRVKDGDRWRVVEGPVKTKASRRMVDLSPAVVQVFLGIPAGDDPERDCLFRAGMGDGRLRLRLGGGSIDPDGVDRAFKRHLDLAGLPGEIRFHDCRHTFASLLIAANAQPKYIQAQMGHTSITTTMDRYGHLMGSGFERVGERLDRVVSGADQGTSKARDAQSEVAGARQPQ